jgi:hypothetical protein
VVYEKVRSIVAVMLACARCCVILVVVLVIRAFVVWRRVLFVV